MGSQKHYEKKTRTDKGLLQRKSAELNDIQKRIDQIESDILTVSSEHIETLDKELNRLYIKQRSVRLIGETKTNCLLPNIPSGMMLKGRSF
jgi:hypothetical protein